jgi:hypothetical protein
MLSMWHLREALSYQFNAPPSHHIASPASMKLEFIMNLFIFHHRSEFYPTLSKSFHLGCFLL